MPSLPPITDRAVVDARGARVAQDPARPYAHFVERERSRSGEIEDAAAIFVTNRECPFHCVVCDLWKYATEHRVPEGAVAGQVAWALSALPDTPQVKIYNGGSFFDPQAISRADVAQIQKLVAGRQTLIVECHPRLVDHRCVEFARSIAPVKLELAMGLETVDTSVLPLVKESMTLDDFENAVRFLTRNGVDVRAFILLGLPGHHGAERVEWVKRSLDYAFSVGVECCIVIPVRSGNGIVDRLGRQGHYRKPTLAELESAVRYGVSLKRGRVFADLWDVGKFSDCAWCSTARAEALKRMNLTQLPTTPVDCSCAESN